MKWIQMIMVVFYCKYSMGDLSADVNLPPILSPPFHSLFGSEIGFGIIFRLPTFDEDISVVCGLNYMRVRFLLPTKWMVFKFLTKSSITPYSRINSGFKDVSRWSKQLLSSNTCILLFHKSRSSKDLSPACTRCSRLR